MCDVVYVLHVEELERHVLADRQVAGSFMAAGYKKVKLPELADARAEFDRLLNMPLKRTSSDRRILLEALGVFDAR